MTLETKEIMQEYRIPVAQILSVEKLPDKKLRKYTFFNTQTGEKGSFLSDKKVRHIPEIAGRLELLIDENQSDQFFQGFTQNIQKHEIPELIKFEEPLEKEVIEIKPKKIVTKLAPWQIRELREKGFSWQEVREFCNVSEWTIRRWRKEDEISAEQEENKEKKKAGRPPKIKGYDLSFLHSCRTVYRSQKQKWVAEVFSEKIKQPVSTSIVCRLYKKYGISHLKPTYHYLEQQSLLKKIKPFVEMVKLLPQSRLIAVDECAFYLNEVPRKIYGWKGERIISWKPGNIIERYTLLLCIKNINGQGVIHWKLVEKGAKATDFYDFFYNIRFSEKHYLLLDNASIHHASKQLCLVLGLFPIKETLIYNNIIPTFLVAYTPQLNPVELCFNFLRKWVEEHKPRSFEQLKYIIEQGVKELQEKDMRDYFRHCLEYDFEKVKNEQGFCNL